MRATRRDGDHCITQTSGALLCRFGRSFRDCAASTANTWESTLKHRERCDAVDAMAPMGLVLAALAIPPTEPLLAPPTKRRAPPLRSSTQSTLPPEESAPPDWEAMWAGGGACQAGLVCCRA